MRLGKLEKRILIACKKNPGGTAWPGKLATLRRLADKGYLEREGASIRTELTYLGRYMADSLEAPRQPEPGDYMVDDVAGNSKFFIGEKAHTEAYAYANACGKYVQVYRYVGWQMVAAIHPQEGKLP